MTVAKAMLVSGMCVFTIISGVGESDFSLVQGIFYTVGTRTRAIIRVSGHGLVLLQLETKSCVCHLLEMNT